jgi:hypothetical protein
VVDKAATAAAAAAEDAGEDGAAAATAAAAAAIAAPAAAPAKPALDLGLVYGAAWDALGMASLTGLAVPPAAPRGLKSAAAAAAKAAATLPSALHNDAYSLFTALCRLSMKTLADEDGSASSSSSSSASSTAGASAGHHSKMLSLELLLSVLENSGPAFKTTPAFIIAIKEHLCQSLLGECFLCTVTFYANLAHNLTRSP